MSCPVPGLAALTLLCTLGACAPEPRDDDAPAEGSQRVPITPIPCPAQDAALAKGPPLRLDDAVLDGHADVLEKLQEAIARVEELEAENQELAARLAAREQAHAACQAETDEHKRQIGHLSNDLEAKADALTKLGAELSAAQAELAELRPKATQADSVTDQVADLQKKLDEATATNDKLREQALQADLARVKAQQDLVLLQITMARQKALLKHRATPSEAKAPSPPDAPSEEPSR